jgi:hypothetical protein
MSGFGPDDIPVYVGICMTCLTGMPQYYTYNFKVYVKLCVPATIILMKHHSMIYVTAVLL